MVVSFFFVCLFVCLLVPFFSFFSAVTIELVGLDSSTGLLRSPDVSVPENAANLILCLRLSAGVTLARNVEVTLTTGADGTAQGKVCLLIVKIQFIWLLVSTVITSSTKSIPHCIRKLHFLNF